MNYTIGAVRSVQIEWQYGLTALVKMIGFELPKGLHSEVISGYADWSERFKTGRVLQTAMPRNLKGLQDVDADWTPRYVRPGQSMLDWPITKECHTVYKKTIGHPTVCDDQGAVLQSEVYVDRWIRFVWSNPDWPDPRPKLIPEELTYHVCETTDAAIVPFIFEVPRNKSGNGLATQIGHQMHSEGYRPATLTEMLWYTAKYQDEISENQILIPWAGYSGGFSEGRQLGHHLGLPFVVRHNGVLKLLMNEFLGQRTSVGSGVEYLAVKM